MNVSFQKKLIGGDIVGTSNSDRNLVYDKTLFENDHIKKDHMYVVSNEVLLFK